MKVFRNKKLFVILLILSGITTVFAASFIASEVSFTPRDNKWNVDNAKDALDDLYMRTQSYLYLFEINKDESEIFSSIDFEIDQYHSDIVIDIKPTFKAGHSENDIFEYILLSDGIPVNTSSTSTIKYLKCEDNHRYYFNVIAIDKESKMHKSQLFDYYVLNSYTRTVLPRPMITGEGVMNIKYIAFPDSSRSYFAFEPGVETTSSDSLPVAGYDRDPSTFAGPYNTTYKYLDVDPSAYGKTVTVTTNGKYACIYYPNSSCFRNTSNSAVIPNGLTEFKVYGNEGLNYYEVTVK